MMLTIVAPMGSDSRLDGPTGRQGVSAVPMRPRSGLAVVQGGCFGGPIRFHGTEMN